MKYNKFNDDHISPLIDLAGYMVKRALITNLYGRSYVPYPLEKVIAEYEHWFRDSFDLASQEEIAKDVDQALPLIRKDLLKQFDEDGIKLTH